MIKSVFFDLDDTLISEYDYIKSGLKCVARYLSTCYHKDYFIVYDELLGLFHEDSKMIFNRWYELQGFFPYEEEIILLVNLYRNHQPQLSFFPDVINTINLLKGKGIIVGIITDGSKETQRVKVNAIEATSIFDHIYITDELGKDFWKPNTKIFLKIKEDLRINFDEIVYVGDNPKKDFYFKKSLGINCYRIIRPNGIYKDEEYLEDIKESALLNSLDDILKYI